MTVEEHQKREAEMNTARAEFLKLWLAEKSRSHLPEGAANYYLAQQISWNIFMKAKGLME